MLVFSASFLEQTRMGPLWNVAIVLACWLIGEAASSDHWDYMQRFSNTPDPRRQLYLPSGVETYPSAWVDASQARALSLLSPVLAQCEESQVVVTVKRDLFGTGRLVQVEDLTLGPTGCQPTSYDAAENTVIFSVGLHQCGSVLQMTPEFLVYSISLHYKPTPSPHSVIVRTSPVDVPIECHYPRKNNVSLKAIKPTWIPFTSTISAEEKLRFSLHLMNEGWSAERASNGYQLGEVMYIQAQVIAENHTPLRLFVDSCVATLSPEADSIPRYPIIDYKGCLIDGRDDSSSTFLSPRIRNDVLQFTVDVFRFSKDTRDLIYITCHLKVTAATQVPDLENKACSFRPATNSWAPVEGTTDICSCCETQKCVQTIGQGSRSWDQGGRRLGRDVAAKLDKSKEADADVMLGPILILDSYMTSRTPPDNQNKLSLSAEHGFFQIPWMLVGIILIALTTCLALTTLGIFCTRKRRYNSS
ncbi:zona pellucida sperm-binding protein 3-like [Thamnophis elegans]|uniref:zona pellucida sperm-binding protein 3-like n=1 Tax=Thamnophis elegans TaxID=35005 RepID=UPI0013774062|nr:zona pellucida sperm-binding protein 3-like [Thamnophis elegans]